MTSSYVRRAFEDALAVIVSSPRVTDRSQAAFMAQFFGMFVRFDERLIADTMNAVARRIEDPDVVFFLLKILRDNVRDPSPLAVPVARLAARAHQRGPRPRIRATPP